MSTVESMLALSDKLDSIVHRYGELLADDALSMAANHGVSRPDELRRVFASTAESQRLLRIGVVGRVKAGKSSLLNALVFNGDEVLPQAATPMTAALTTLTYSDKLSATVEFFSASDLEDIRTSHAHFERLRAEQLSKELERLRDPYADMPLSFEQEQQGRAKAERKALNEIKRSHPSLAAAWEQQEKILAAGVTPGDLGASLELRADDLAELNAALQDYVGANGRYMPLTRSVALQLPEPALQDILIVDTPGINDPVRSREERTVDLLKYCDVVLVVSPAGQFLSSEDLSLMGRITRKEGVREVQVVASQVDTQLFGREYAGKPLAEVLRSIRVALGERMTQTLGAYRDNHREIGTTFDRLIAQGKDGVTHHSGICHVMSAQFAQRERWGENARKVWENLSLDYAEYFSAGDSTQSTASLDLLANSAALHAMLQQVRGQKQRILEERLASLSAAKGAALLAYRDELLKYASDQQEKIKASNIEQLEVQKEELKRDAHRLDLELGEAHRDLELKLRRELEQKMRAQLTSHYSGLRRALEDAEGTETRTRTVEKTGKLNSFARWLGVGGTEERSYEQVTVITGHVRNGMQDFSADTNTDIIKAAEDAVHAWRTEVRERLVQVLRKVVGDANLDEVLAGRTIREIVNLIQMPTPTTDLSTPAALSPKGTLRGNDAEEYLEAARDYMAELNRRFGAAIAQYLHDVADRLDIDVAGRFVEGYLRRIQHLEEQITNKAQTADRFRELALELKEARL